MSRRPRAPRPVPHDYTPDIDQLHHRLSALTLRWQGVAPTSPSLAEALEELSTTVEELHAMNEDLTVSQQAAIAGQRRYQELFEGVPEAYLVTDPQGLVRRLTGLRHISSTSTVRSSWGSPSRCSSPRTCAELFSPSSPGYATGQKSASGSWACSRAIVQSS